MFADDKVTFDLGGPLVKQLVILDRTSTKYAYGDTKEDWDEVRHRLPQLTDRLVANYELNLRNSKSLGKGFGTHLPYKLLSKAGLDSIFRDSRSLDRTNENWKKFYELYPGSHGYISFSDVGFDREAGKALVYFVHWCGTLCGSGHYVLLSKAADGWQVMTRTMIWIS